MKRLLPLILIVFFQVSCATAGKSTDVTATAPSPNSSTAPMVVHEPSGFEIDQAFGSWDYVGNHSFTEDGKNMSFGFNSTKIPYMKGTYYVYPGGVGLPKESLYAHFKQTIETTGTVYDEVIVHLEDAGTFTKDDIEYNSTFAILEYREDGIIKGSYLIIHEINGWLVKIRLTLPAQELENASEDIQLFFTQFKVPTLPL